MAHFTPDLFPFRPGDGHFTPNHPPFLMSQCHDGTFSYRFAAAKQKKRTSLPALIVNFSRTLTLGYN